jgi:hypothetical protein
MLQNKNIRSWMDTTSATKNTKLTFAEIEITPLGNV